MTWMHINKDNSVIKVLEEDNYLANPNITHEDHKGS